MGRGVGRENSGQGDVGGQPRFPDARKWVAPPAFVTLKAALNSAFPRLF